MCPVEINSMSVSGVYVDERFTALPYTVASGEKKLISYRHPPAFRYMVFGTDRGGYYVDTRNTFNPKIEIEVGDELHLGKVTLIGLEKGR